MQMIKDLLTFLRITIYLYRKHPGKVFKNCGTIDNQPSFTIFDRDNDKRITVRLTLDAWRDLSNRQIGSMLR